MKKTHLRLTWKKDGENEIQDPNTLRVEHHERWKILCYNGYKGAQECLRSIRPNKSWIMVSWIYTKKTSIGLCQATEYLSKISLEFRAHLEMFSVKSGVGKRINTMKYSRCSLDWLVHILVCTLYFIMIQLDFICAKIFSYQSEKISLGSEGRYRNYIEKNTRIAWVSSSV